MIKRLYLAAAIFGLVLPYAAFVPFLLEHGLNLALFAEQMFANRIAAFFSLDVIVSSLALWIFVFSEGRRLGMRRLWLYIACNLLVGVSLALPLFLYARAGRVQS